MIEITVNGKEKSIEPGITVERLLLLLELKEERVVIERNQNILQPSEFDKVVVQEGDNLEIVRFVGGG